MGMPKPVTKVEPSYLNGSNEELFDLKRSVYV